MANGLTQAKMVERMYTELVGLDGISGLVKEHHETREQMKLMASAMVSKADCSEIREVQGSRKVKVFGIIKDALIVVGMIMTVLLGSGILRGAP